MNTSLRHWAAAVTVLVLSGLTSIAIIAPGQGTLRALHADGRSADLPLVSTRVEAEISGIVARVWVEQVFENPLDETIDAVYVFPMVPRAAVHQMSIEIEGRRLRGVVVPRQEARRSYEQAREQGFRAGLLELLEGDVFKQSVANIEAGSEVRVQVEIIAPLDYDDGRYRFIFPMVVIPRFQLGAGGWAEVEALSSNASVDPPQWRSGESLSLTVQIASGLKLAAIESPSHEVKLQQADDHHATASLESTGMIANRDFVLDISVDASLDLGLLAHRTGNEDGYFNLILMPQPEMPPASAAAKELVFVVDTSGSMTGEPLETAKRLMLAATDLMNPGDSFNIVIFGSSANVLFKHSLPCSRPNLERARLRIRRMGTNGGTEITAALDAAFELPRDGDKERIVVVLSDGAVGPEEEILEIVHLRPEDTRVFTVGIGPGPNHSLLGGMAQQGSGAFVSVSPHGNVEKTIARFFRWISRPHLSDLEIDWGTAPVEALNPRKLPDLFPDRPLVVSGRYRWGVEEQIVLRGTRAGTPWEKSFLIVLPEIEEKNQALAAHWAQREIETLKDKLLGSQAPDVEQEILDLALAHQLVTEYTSFVVVDESVVVNRPPEVQRYGTTDRVAEVRVVATCSIVMLEGAEYSTTVSDSFLESLPVLGREYRNVLAMAPGIVDADGDGNPNVHGSRSRNFQMSVDGVSNVDPLTGAFVTSINPDSIEEIEILGAGSEATFGGTVGGFGRIVTKSGSNDFEGMLNLDWMPRAFNTRTAPFDGSEAQTDLRLGIASGGPIAKDRLWYFVSQDRFLKQHPLAIARGADALVEGHATRHASSLTWQISPRHKLRSTLRHNTDEMDPAFATTLVAPGLAALYGDRETSFETTWTSPQTPNFFFELSTSFSDRVTRVIPLSPWDHPSALDLSVGGIQLGPWPSSRTEGARLLSHRLHAEQFIVGFLGGDHRLQAELSYDGYAFDRSLRHKDLNLLSTAVAADLLFAVPEEKQEANIGRWSAQISDSFTPLATWNIGVSLRFWMEGYDGEGWRNLSPEAERTEWDRYLDSCLASGIESVEQCLASGGVSLFTVHPADLPGSAGCEGVVNPWQCSTISMAIDQGSPISQRIPERTAERRSGLDLGLRVSWDPWDDGKTRVTAAWNRGHGNPSHLPLFAESQPSGSARLAGGSPAAGQPHGGFASWQLSRDLDVERFSDWSLILEREIAAETTIRARYRERRAWNVLGLSDLNSRAVTWDAALALIPERDAICEQIGDYADCFGSFGLNAAGEPIDGPDGLPDQEPISPFWGPLPTLGSLGHSRYSEFVLSLRRRYYQNWELSTSYTFSRHRRDGSSAVDALGSFVFMPENVPGYANLDQRHLFKVAGRVFIPYGGGFRIGASFDWRSGAAYSIVQDALTSSYPTNLGSEENPYLFQSMATRRGYPTGRRNDQRNPPTMELSLRVTKDFYLGSTRLSLGLEVYDLFNREDLTITQVQRVVSPSDDGEQIVNDHPVGYYLPGRKYQLVAGLTW